MSKAILVIDIPNLESHEIDSYDMVADLKVKSLVLGGERYDFKLKNVIIKPLPDYKINSNQSGIYKSDLDRGYDNCLEEILGGNNVYK